MKKDKTEYLDKWIIDHDLKITRLPKIIEDSGVGENLVTALRKRRRLFDTKEEAMKMVESVNNIVDKLVSVQDIDILSLCFRYSEDLLRTFYENSTLERTYLVNCDSLIYFEFIKIMADGIPNETRRTGKAELLLKLRGFGRFPIEVFYDMLVSFGFLKKGQHRHDLRLFPTCKGLRYGFTVINSGKDNESAEKIIPLFMRTRSMIYWGK